MLLNDAITRLNYRCDELGIPRPDPLHVEALILTGLNQLANECQKDARRRYVTKDFTSISITSGIADLSGQTAMLVDWIYRVVHSVHGTLSQVPNRSDLDNPRNQLVYWCCVSDGKIYIRNGDGVTLPDAGTLVVQAGFTPVIVAASSTLHVQLDDDFLELMVGLLAAQQVAA